MDDNIKTSAISLFLMCIILIIFTGIFVYQRDDARLKLHAANNAITELQTAYDFEKTKVDGLSAELGNVNNKLKNANIVIEDLKNTGYDLVYMGDFKLTYYCDSRYDHICGGTGVTASGQPTEVGVTIAVDKNVIPLGTKVYIEGVGFMEAQDTGGAVIGNHIDILVEDHYTAEQLGVQNGGVWLLIAK